MASKTGIEWTDATWSPLRVRVREDAAQIARDKNYSSLVQIGERMAGRVGQHCEHVSDGCKLCYSGTWQGRCLKSGGTGLPFDRRSRDLIEPFVDEKTLLQPLRWREPKKIFVENQSDLFGEWYTDEMIDRVFSAMSGCRQHTFQVLTKRPERMVKYLSRFKSDGRGWVTPGGVDAELTHCPVDAACWPIPNVWLGVSVENQATADARIPLLLQTPAAKRFVSAEPLLSRVDLSKWLRGYKSHDTGGASVFGATCDRSLLDRPRGQDLETPPSDSRKPTRHSAILEGPRPDHQSREISFGRLPDGDVLGRQEAAQGVRASRGVDGDGATGYPSELAGKPQERAPQRHPSAQSGMLNSFGKCDPCDSGTWEEGQGSIGRGEFISESDGATGNGDSRPIGTSVSIENRGEIRHKTGHGIGYHPPQELGASGLDWIIIGGESGPGSRPFDIQWARNTIAQCKAAGVACFVKQLGSKPQDVAFPYDVSEIESRRWQSDGWTRITMDAPPGSHWRKYMRLKDRKGGSMEEWPLHLRVREFPNS